MDDLENKTEGLDNLDTEAALDDTAEKPAEEEETLEEFLSDDEDEEDEDGLWEEEEALPATDEPGDDKPKKEKKKLSKGKKILITILAIVAGIAVCVAGLCIYSVVSGSTSVTVDMEATAVTLDDTETTAAEYTFYYAYLYSYYYSYISYGSIDADDIADLALQEVCYTTYIYNMAIADGFELSDDDYEDYVTASVESYTEYAESYEMTLEEYLEASYGEGFTEELFVALLEKNAIAAVYKDEIDSDIEDYYYNDNDGEDEVEEYYSANYVTYDTASVKYYYFTDSDDMTAEEKAEEFIALVEEGEESIEYIIYNYYASSSYSYDEDFCPTAEGYTYDEIYDEFGEDVAEWLFEVDDDENYVNEGGELEYFELNSLIYVFYVSEAPGRDETCPVTYIDIFIAYEDADDITEEDLLTVAASATEIYDLYIEYLEDEDEDVDEDYFAELAEEYTESSSDGGYEEDVTTDTDAVIAWAYDSSREYGDVEVVEDTDGYHVLFFVEMSSTAAWYSDIAETLIDSAVSDYWAEAESCYTEAETVDDVLDDIATMIQELFG